MEWASGASPGQSIGHCFCFAAPMPFTQWCNIQLLTTYQCSAHLEKANGKALLNVCSRACACALSVPSATLPSLIREWEGEQDWGMMTTHTHVGGQKWALPVQLVPWMGWLCGHAKPSQMFRAVFLKLQVRTYQ